MDKLKARTPCDGLLPLKIGSVELTEEGAGAIHSISPFRDQKKAVSDAMKAAHGMTYPAANRATGKAGARAVFSGRGQALVLGPALAPIVGAAMTDQSDAWACVTLDGPSARDVLARLVPIDLRESAFKRGHAARTLLMHMPVVLMRSGAERYEIMPSLRASRCPMIGGSPTS